MPNDDSFLLTGSGEKQMEDGKQDLKKIVSLAISNWYYLLIALIIAITCAFLFNKFTIPVYKVNATLLINEDIKGSSLGNREIFQGYDLGTGAKNLDNQIMVLSSKTLIDRSIDELDYYIEYYHRGLFRKMVLYPESPIKIVPENTDSLPRNIEFKFKYLDNNNFGFSAKTGSNQKLDTIASFGSLLKFKDSSFSIELHNDKWFDNKKNRKIYFINNDRKKLVESYKRRIKVESVSKNGTIVEVSLEGTNPLRDKDFLGKLTEIFLNNSLDKKNQEAIRTIQFIDDQLIGISDSLIITENKLQQFRSRNRVMNLSAQGQVIIDQAMSLENQKARLGIEANYYNYLADYLDKDNAGQAPIAPATMGITDPGLTRLVSDLTDLQGQLYSKSLGEKNPLQTQLSQRVRNIKAALKETLNGVRRSNNMAMSDISEQIRAINAQATALPVTERQLLGIERKYKLNDELYTFLLEKRAEAQILKASNMPDNELIDASDSSIDPIKPNKVMVYLFALIFGVGFTFLWIIIDDAFNNKILKDEDLIKITSLPITGHIPHSYQGKNKIFFSEGSSFTAEAFRSLRSRMQFFTKDIKTPIILITSSMPDEGKTFVAINLASAYSLVGKKTVLVDFDLRKPKIYADFDIDNEVGVSTYLTGKHKIEEIIKATAYENLFVLPAGPIPPNPSELTVLDKTNELFAFLKEKYDCIIIDSSPIGPVSDAFHLTMLADTCILVARQNITLKEILDDTIREIKMNRIHNISVTLNDIRFEYKRYKYDGKYLNKLSNFRRNF